MQKIQRLFTGIPFWLCALAVFLLCGTAVIGRDYVTEEELLVIQMLFRRDEVNRDIQYSAWNVLCSAGGMWLSMFAPILAVIPFVPEYLSERINQNSRFIISRLGGRRYTLGTLLSAMLSGGFVFVCGYAAFFIFAYCFFPSIQEYSSESIALYVEIQNSSSASWYKQMLLHQQLFLPVIIQFLQMFLFGACSTLPAVVLAAFLRNTYVVICLPFFLVYAWTQANARLWALAYADFENINQTLARFAKLTDPSAIRFLIINGNVGTWQLAVHLGVCAICCVMFCFIRNRSVDCGE